MPPLQRQPPRWRDDPHAIRPMLATLAEASLTDPALVYEPKYDGIRALVHIEPGGEVVIRSRLGNVKNAQFPDLVRDLAAFGRRLKQPLLVDGEIVALTSAGEPTGFQKLQGRIHLTTVRELAIPHGQPVAFVAFDLLRDGDADLRSLPFVERRAHLERVFRLPRRRAPGNRAPLRLTNAVAGDGRALMKEALERGWEGVIAKEAASRYEAGRRSPAWKKLKLVHRQEFVIGGWTEPRQTRQHLGALLLGVYDRDGHLIYAGHSGTGFDRKELEKLSRLLGPLETGVCPFAIPPRTNERPHWVKPQLVAEVKFTEWTDEGFLRHPVYLGLRDDVKPETVRREPIVQQSTRELARRSGSVAHTFRPAQASVAQTFPPPLAAVTGELRRGAPKRQRREGGRSAPAAARISPSSAAAQTSPSSAAARRSPSSAAARTFRSASRARGKLRLSPEVRAVIEQLEDLEQRNRDGVIQMPDGHSLKVTNLRKVFWPALGITKGELMRYYIRVSPFLLPAVEDRPLVLKRFPNGIEGKQQFYQQRVLQDAPPGVRVEMVAGDPAAHEEEGDFPRFIGGSLTTLLYMTQLAAISQDPWFSRAQTPEFADHTAIDLDPQADAPFARVLDAARWVRDELATLGTPSVPKTSGSRGLHIYIPLPPRTTYESGMLFCQIVATLVATKHPKAATVVRIVRARDTRSVYVDYLQNILGKTLATAYSARASEYAGVSTPLRWTEIDEGIDPRDFTIRTAPERFEAVGDLWAALRTGKRADLRAILRYTRT